MSCHTASALDEPPQGQRREIVLVGHPNVGKSVLFGRLTGRYVTVANYPGTTVDVFRGTASPLAASSTCCRSVP